MSTEPTTDRADDPRLTAYALGEMSADERRAFEAEIAGDAEAEREIASIAAAAELLRGEVRRGPDTLGEAQRRAIDEALAKREASPAGGGRPEAAPTEGAPTEPGARVVPITAAATKRQSRWRAVWIAVPAVAAAAGLLFVGQAQRSAEPVESRAVAVGGPPGAAQDAPMSQKAEAAATAGPMAPPPPMAAAPSPVSRSVEGKQGLEKAKSKADVPGARPRPMSLHDEADGRIETPRPPSPVVTEPSEPLPENEFVPTAKDPRSTFSIDVDTASYAVVRRSIENGALPHPSMVRLEEMINYFPYADPPPDDAPFRVATDVASAPWAPQHRLLRIALKGREVEMAKRPPSNLVFLLDVSGSMMGADRLGLVKQGLSMLVQQLDERDRVSIVVYAGSSGLVLPPTPGNDKRTILDALDRLEAGGSTNGGAGIQLAYGQAKAAFVKGGANRVILATDGDFNVGVSGKEELTALAANEAKSGVFLTVLGFGQGNLRDGTLEQIADKGNGQYAYVDSLAEAKKVLVEQASGTLLTIAKDVKIQVTFDPKTVQSARLVGYENRVLAHQDFADDTKDAGDVGAGHSVTALYEIVPVATGAGTHLADVALRFKLPDGATSRLLEVPVVDGGGSFEGASTDLRFGAAVAGFGMVLRGSRHRGDFGLADAARIAEGALGDDVGGHRRGFVTLARKAEALRGR